MVMALVWNDAKSFKHHVEHMRMFRQSHHSDITIVFTLLKDMPTTCVIHLPNETGGARDSFSVGGESALVPVREVTLPRNSQN